MVRDSQVGEKAHQQCEAMNHPDRSLPSSPSVCQMDSYTAGAGLATLAVSHENTPHLALSASPSALSNSPRVLSIPPFVAARSLNLPLPRSSAEHSARDGRASILGIVASTGAKDSAEKLTAPAGGRTPDMRSTRGRLDLSTWPMGLCKMSLHQLPIHLTCACSRGSHVAAVHRHVLRGSGAGVSKRTHKGARVRARRARRTVKSLWLL